MMAKDWFPALIIHVKIAEIPNSSAVERKPAAAV